MAYTLGEFLAHAIAMEREAAERYLELADMMEAHHNLDVARLFRDMHRYSTLHGDSITQRAGALELPQLRSWQYRWLAPTEVGDEDGFDYRLKPRQALEYALTNERRAAEFYQAVAGQSGDAEVRSLAGEFAAEEREHSAALERKLAEASPF